MKHYKSLFIIILLLLAGQSAFAQYFLKSYDFPPFTTPRSTDIGRSIEPVTAFPMGGSPFGWTIAGFSNSTPAAGGYNWMFLKLSSTGVVSCATLLGLPFDDSCFSHVKFLDSPVNVLAGFYTMPSPSGLKEKASWSMVDTNCAVLMSRMIADTARHQYRWVTRTPANTFTLTGYIQRFTPTAVDRIIASQYTPGGVLVWAFEYFPPYPYVIERAYSICYQPTDGSYAITGVTNRFTGPGGALQVFIMKISAAGIPIWFKGYSPLMGAASQSRKIVALPDGGFAVAGWSPAYDAANDIWVFKVDGMGIPVWSNTYGIPGTREESYGLIYQATDMTLVLTGLRTTAEDILIGKVTEAAGAPIWFRTYPNAAGSDRGYDLEEAAGPMGYAVTGQLYAAASSSLDAFLLRTNSLGIVGPGCLDSLILQVRPGVWYDQCGRQPYQLSDMPVNPQIIQPNVQTRDFCTLSGVQGTINQTPNAFVLEQNYPNPFNPTTNIRYQVLNNSMVKLAVYNAAGELVSLLVNEIKQAGSYEISVDGSKFASGIYFYKLEADGFTDTKKMMLIK